MAQESIRAWLKGERVRTWLRFLAAVGGLSIAFVLALLSTAARESGNLLLTAVLASSALLLAVATGLVTLPHLVRRIAAGRIKDVLRYDVTREGMVYFALILVITLAAINTGNNLLFLVVSAMLAAIIVSGVTSAAVLLGLDATLEMPPQLFARQPAMAQLMIRNRKRIHPIFSVRISQPPATKSRKHWKLRHSIFEFPAPRPGRQSWVHLRDISFERQSDEPEKKSFLEASFYLPFLAPKQSVQLEVALFFAQRGLYKQQKLCFSTRFPFSFLHKSRIIPLEAEALVYPSVELSQRMQQLLPRIAGEQESRQRGTGSDLYGLRDYQPDDPARRLDWKASARSGTLKLREYANEEGRRLRVVFDNPLPGRLSPEAYEHAVEEAASLAWHLADKKVALSFAATAVPLTTSVHDFLRHLATIQPDEETNVFDSLPNDGAFLLVFTAQMAETLPGWLREGSHIIPLG